MAVLMDVARINSAEATIKTSRMVSTGCFIGLFIGCSGLFFLLPQLVERVREAREACRLVGWSL